MGTLDSRGLNAWTVPKHFFPGYLKICTFWNINFKGNYAESNFSCHHKNGR